MLKGVYVNGIYVIAINKAYPLSFEIKDIKLLQRLDFTNGKRIGDVYGFICKRCGSEWEVNQPRRHEPYCKYFQRDA